MTRADRGDSGEYSALDALAHQWLRTLKAQCFIPGSRARARVLLRDLLEQLVAACRAEPFDPVIGARVGADLVAARMAAPGVLGVTVPLLAEQLPALLDPDAPDAPGRVLPLLGQLAQGFTAATRDSSANVAEALYRTERVVWRKEQRRLHSQLQRARLHDPVTDLPNRTALREHLRTLIAGAPADSRLGICLLRIDDFAPLNDALGHPHGDNLLHTLALRLQETIAALAQGIPASEDHPGAGYRYHLAHLGGEQFVISVADTTGTDELVKITRLARHAISTASLPWIDGYQLKLNTIAGIVEGPANTDDADTWLRNAHIALAWTHSDHQPHAVYEPARAQIDLRRHRLTAAMPDALERGEFQPHFQPIYALAERTIIGVEALARWQRRDFTIPLGPQEFIAPAEHTGLIRPLGRTLLRQACHHGSTWHTSGHPLLISVNLSPLQLAEPDLLASIQEILDHSRLPAQALQLEITETTAVHSPAGLLHELADRGISLALDDFGTGHANLDALSRLPVTTVKLARELVAGLNNPEDTAAAAIAYRTIQLCHDLNRTVTAEGIETETQYTALRTRGCDHGQGFLFAKPAPPAAITRLLTASQRTSSR